MCGTRKEPEAESPRVVLYDLLATQASAADKRAAGTSRCLYFPSRISGSFTRARSLHRTREEAAPSTIPEE